MSEQEKFSPTAPAASESASVAPPSPPAVESITEESDIRLFLQSGVPTELVRAALRAAWATDPAIRDFVGIAESQWDFNDPGAMPGFGPLAAMQGAPSVVKSSVSPLDGTPALERRAEIVNPQRDGQLDKVWLSSGGGNKNPGNEEVTGQTAQPRDGGADSRLGRHGGALPK